MAVLLLGVVPVYIVELNGALLILRTHERRALFRAFICKSADDTGFKMYRIYTLIIQNLYIFADITHTMSLSDQTKELTAELTV